ncbi:unnamed protein product [Peniophora sp. CBMAI 1063]|nr:unnamed protein product [Peniophora sp. CBMAI 1063]
MADIMNPHQEQQQQREESGSRAPSRALSRSDSIGTSDSEPGIQDQRRRRRGGRKQQGGDLPGVDEVEDTGRAVTNTANQVGRTAEGVTRGAADDDKPLKLRLDLNIDVDIQIKATVHGDITLSLLR